MSLRVAAGLSVRESDTQEAVMQRIVPNLWINDGKIEEAVEFYCSLFEGAKVVTSTEYGPEAGKWAGQKMAIFFELQGHPYVAINGADTSFTPNESISLAVPCDTQEEIDRLWEALTKEGEPGPCGWLKDRYGFSWQVYPTRLDEMLADPDPEKVRRAVACFMKIDKRAFDIAELEEAFRA